MTNHLNSVKQVEDPQPYDFPDMDHTTDGADRDVSFAIGAVAAPSITVDAGSAAAAASSASDAIANDLKSIIGYSLLNFHNVALYN